MNKIFLLMIIGLFFIGCGLLIDIEPRTVALTSVELGYDMKPGVEYVYKNSENSRYIESNYEYPDNWNCLNISNNYIIENPDWCVFVIKQPGNNKSHAANYKIIDDVFYVRDDYWEISYEFKDWHDLPLMLYKPGDTINPNRFIFRVNVDDYYV